MALDKLDILSKMAYFAKCKKTAIRHLLEFCRPLNDEQSALMNIFYSAYFTYWLGLVDYLIKDVSFIKQEDIENLVGSKDNYYYLRNLRNAVIHRAEDLANKGTVINNTENKALAFISAPLASISGFLRFLARISAFSGIYIRFGRHVYPV